jgi:RNA polymerase sigma factor (sigma-70 family)
MVDSSFPHVDLSPLTPRQREVVEMRYASRLSWRAIADLIGIDQTTVREHHDAALKRLRTSPYPHTSPIK